MVDTSLKLYLPFDDPDGSKAYDFSIGRADATLSEGARFSRDAKTGKSLDLNYGECQTATTIPLSSDFTLCFYVQPKVNSLGWLLNFNGINNYLEEWHSVRANEWNFVAFVKDGYIFKVYINKELAAVKILPGTPTGFSVNTEGLGMSNALIDELRLYNRAISEKELQTLQADTDVEYYIDGINFKDYGVYVSDAKGLLDRLAQKESLSVDWDNYHGLTRDRKRKRYKEREITLDCFLEASSRSAFVEWQRRFFSLFDGDGTHRLKVEYDGTTKPLVYEVDLVSEVDVNKKWGTYNNDLMVGTFSLKLQEDEPVKRVLRHISNQYNSIASIQVSSSKKLNIYWGDGTATYNVSGNEITARHTYSLPGEYDIVITGVIEDIESFSTNAIVIWDLLK